MSVSLPKRAPQNVSWIAILIVPPSQGLAHTRLCFSMLSSAMINPIGELGGAGGFPSMPSDAMNTTPSASNSACTYAVSTQLSARSGSRFAQARKIAGEIDQSTTEAPSTENQPSAFSSAL